MAKDETNQKLDRVITMLLDTNDRLTKVEENMATREDIDHLTTSLDKFMKQVDTYYKEMLALKIKVDRMEKWIHILANKAGVTLDN